MMDFGKATRGAFIRAQGQRSRAACLVQFAGRLWRACRPGRLPVPSSMLALRCHRRADGLFYVGPEPAP